MSRYDSLYNRYKQEANAYAASYGIIGGVGSDIYQFGKGDGQDIIYSTSDTTAGKIDTLQFKPGVAASEVTLGTSGTWLEIKIAGTTDQIIVENFLYQDSAANAYNPLQQIKFADGTTWNLEEILAKLYAGTDAAETLNGTLNADTINGLGGADYLYGNAGNDTLDGGAGDDYVTGDVGSDIYQFGKGDGQDIIYSNSDTTTGEIDTLQFKPGVAASEVTLGTLDTWLVIKIAGTTDQISVENFLYQDSAANAYNPLQQIKFADGTTWNLEEILAKLYAGNDPLDGGAGNDYVTGVSRSPPIPTYGS